MRVLALFSLPSALLVSGVGAQTNWPAPPTPVGNPTTAAKVLLGKALFWDEQLSTTGSVACGTCHILSHGGSDPRSLTALHPGPDGVFGTPDDRRASPGVPANDGNGTYTGAPGFGAGPQVTPRTAPTVINAAYLGALFWDGRVDDGVFRDPVTGQIVLNGDAQLENLIAKPPVDAIEMGHPGRSWMDVVQRVQGVEPLALASHLPGPLATFALGQTYPALFQQAFGSAGVDASRIIMAIAAYMRTLVSDGSRVDAFLAGTGTLTIVEQNGQQFAEFICVRCHGDIDHNVFLLGPASVRFRNTGVRPIAEDPGRSAVTQSAADEGMFKAPDLRNVALRPPFFHDGSAATLADAVAFYARGGDFHVNQNPLMNALPGFFAGSPRLEAELVAFLEAFTDPRVESELPPFDRPTLFTEGPNKNLLLPAGTPGTGGIVPRAVAVEPARIGGRVTVAVDRGQPGEFALLLWDVAVTPGPRTFFGLSVQLALTPATTLAVAGSLQGMPGEAWLSWSQILPADPAFAGQRLFGQWLVTDPAGSNGFATSGAFGLRLQ